MVDFPQLRSIGAGDGEESSGPIYDSVSFCQGLFQYHLTEVNNHPGKYLAVEGLYGQFNQWIAYVGALAVPKASLDARLASHQNLKDMVLELLSMICANLKWGMTVLENVEGPNLTVHSQPRRSRRPPVRNKSRKVCCTGRNRQTFHPVGEHTTFCTSNSSAKARAFWSTGRLYVSSPCGEKVSAC